MEASIIIPARNEEKALAVTLEHIFKFVRPDWEVIVVDGASTDGTSGVAYQYPCRVVPQFSFQLGKGRGLRLGFQTARGDKVVWTDANGTYPVSVIPRVIAELDKWDVIVCSRKWGRENIPKFNRFGNWLFKVLIKGLYGFEGNDPCTGLWGIKREHLTRMNLTSTHFAIEPEISIKVGRMKLKTLDIPITYTPRVGSSKLNPVKVGFEDMWTILKLIGWRPK